jgi:hypothetical protein
MSSGERRRAPPAFATSYAKYRALYNFVSEKRPLPDTRVNDKDALLFKSFTIKFMILPEHIKLTVRPIDDIFCLAAPYMTDKGI